MLRDSRAVLRAIVDPRRVACAGAAATIALVVAATAGCGIKGPLRLPPPPAAAAPDANAAKPAAAPEAPPKPAPPDTPAVPAPPAPPPVKP